MRAWSPASRPPSSGPGFIAPAGRTNLVSLAEALGVRAPAANRLCDRMVAAGLIVQELNEERRREVALEATRDGRELVAAVAASRRERLRALLGEMSPADRDTLLTGLRALAASAPTTSHVPSVYL